VLSRAVSDLRAEKGMEIFLHPSAAIRAGNEIFVPCQVGFRDAASKGVEGIEDETR